MLRRQRRDQLYQCIDGAFARKLKPYVVLLEPARRFSALARNRHRPAGDRFVEPIRKKPFRIEALLEIIDAPGKMAASVEVRKVSRSVRTDIFDVGAGDRLAEL